MNIQNDVSFNPIDYITLWFNIHSERIVTNNEEFNFVFIENENNQEFIWENVKFNKKYILIKTNKKIQRNEDIQCTYYKDNLHDKVNYCYTDSLNDSFFNNGIFIIENVISETLSDQLIEIIDSKSTNTKKEKMEKNQNVNCDYIHLENTRFENQIIEIIKYIIEYNYISYKILSKGDSGYCLRKIYGPTRLHSDGLLVDENKYFSPKKN